MNYFWISNGINYPSIKLGNTFKKEKELNKGFSLFNFSLLLKGF
jgi:hypothetical protein